MNSQFVTIRAQKMQDKTMQNRKIMDEIAGVDNTGLGQ